MKRKTKFFILAILLVISVAAYIKVSKANEDQSLKEIQYREHLLNTVDSLNQLNDSLLKEIGYNKNLRIEAQNLIGRNIPESFTDTDMRTVYAVAKRHHLPVEIILKLIYAESSFKASAKSNVGASGYMQIMPKTYKAFADTLGIKVHDNTANLEVGIYYLNHLHDMWKGYSNRWHLTLMSYNYGPSKIASNIEYYSSEQFQKYDYIRKILN